MGRRSRCRALPAVPLAASTVLPAAGRRPHRRVLSSAPALNRRRCSPLPPPPPLRSPPIELRFDRPFVFDIVHEESGLALFNGEIYKVEEWKAQA